MTSARCVQARLALTGVDPRRLSRAIAQVVERHAILDGASWSTTDLCAIPTNAREGVRERHLQDARRALAPSPASGAGVRAQLLTWDREHHDLLLTLDGRRADAGTMGAFVADAMTAYAGAPRGDAAPSYAEIVEWQRALAHEEGAERGRQYWELHGLGRGEAPPEPPASTGSSVLPAAPVSPEAPESIGSMESRSEQLSPVSQFERIDRAGALWQTAERAAAASGCSLPALLLASWQALFFRLDRTIPLTGVTVPARKYPELADVVGPLDVTMPFAIRARGDMSAAAFTRAVDRVWLGSIEWGEYYDWRTHGLPPDHAYEIGFAHVDWPDASTLGALQAQLTHPRLDLIDARIALTCCAAGDHRELAIQFDPRVHARAGVRRLARLWTVLLEDVASRPQATLDSLQLLTPSERTQIVTDWNDTTHVWTDAGATPSLVSWLDRQAARTPGAPAVWADGIVWSYAELHAQANQIARRLRRLGVTTESRVAVWLPRSAQMVAALAGVVKAGGAFVPLDPVAPPARLAFQVADVAATVVLTDMAHAADVPTGGYAIEVLDARDAAWRREESTPLAIDVTADQLAYVIYTSGSTGEPKGAMNTQRGIANRLAWMRDAYALTPADRVLQKTSISFDVSVWELFFPLGIGASVVIARPGGQGDPAYLADLIQRAGVTVMHFVPAMLETFVEAGGFAACAGVRLIVSSGEALSGPLARRCLAAWNGRLENLYGPTEASIEVTRQSCTPEAIAGAFVPIGRPIANTQTYVLDAHGNPAPIGVIGELYLGGVQVARGYWGRSALTAERFVPDPFGHTPGARLYRTGDRARYRPDGVIEYIGRTDRQIKLHGHRIELGEIEAALRRDPHVLDAVITVNGGGDDRRLVAYVIPRRHANAPAPAGNDAALALRQTLRSSLPPYMVPAYIVLLDAFPLTHSGKIDRRRLPAPDAVNAQTREYIAPRTPLEEIIVRSWTEVLGHPRISVGDQFLSVGGDSLSAVRVLVRLREALGRDLALRTLFEHPTPAALAEALSRPDGDGATEPPLAPVSRDVPPPASFGQERLWVVDSVTGSQAYRVTLAAQADGPIDLPALAHAFTALAMRHEVLRTTIGTRDGRPVQVIAPSADTPLRHIDLRALTPQARMRAADATRRALERYPFDLQAGPLWVASIIRLDDHTLHLTCNMHHIVADGWSIGVLLRDLSALYQAAQSGQPAPLPDLTVQYADYAAWQRRAVTPERQAAEVAYWRTQLADVVPLALPTDRPRGPLPGVQGGAVTMTWDAALSGEVERWTQAQGATLFMTLLAAWQALLARYAGQQDVAVGTPIAQRTKEALEPLIGFFLNTLVLRTPVDSAMTWRALVSEVRTRALWAYAHQTMPFERIIEELQPERDLARTPFFQVMFVFQNNPRPAIDLGGLRMTPLDARTHAAMYDLQLEATSQPEGIAWRLRYDALLFERATVERMLEHLTAFVRAAVASPDVPIGTLSMLSDAERRQIDGAAHFPLAASGANAAAIADDWPLDQSITDRFHHIAAQVPAQLAVKTREVSWSYRELSRRSTRIARGITQARARERTGAGRVALLCAHDARMLVAILGVLEAGDAYVPLDPFAPVARLRQIWSDAEPDVLVTDPAHEALAREIAQAAPVLVMGDTDSTWALPPVSPDAPAYLLYTSGSTGEPKGVVQSHRNVQYFIRTYATNLGLQPADRLTLLPAYGFDAAVMDIFGALLTGATAYPFSLRDRTPQELADVIDRERITVLHATPTVFRMLTSSLGAGRVLSSVRLVVLGGEAAWQSDAEQGMRHFARECVLVNGLGPTESTVTLQSFTRHGDRLTRAALPVGYPVRGTRVRLLDAQGYDAEVFGQVVVESPHVALGYWRRDDLTRTAFEEVEGQPGVRRYRTGDRARRLPDGSLEFAGRADQQVKIRGYRVELSEIETVLAAHPAVKACAVALAPDAAGADTLIAYIVPRDGEVPARRELRQFVAARLPGPMVPSRFVALDALPWRANGKVDREALPPVPPIGSSTAAYVAPRGHYEQQVAELWREVLGAERPGVHDNFFELGGDSIKAITIAARLRALGVAATPWLLFQHQTIADLAPALTSAPVDEDASLALDEAGASLGLPEDQLDRLAARVEFEVS